MSGESRSAQRHGIRSDAGPFGRGAPSDTSRLQRGPSAASWRTPRASFTCCRTITFSRTRMAPRKATSFFSLDQLIDRKSTRLNSSHSQISYAVFCLKKKKKKKKNKKKEN